jgi:D-glycero-alpha-D-manno-heptose-7-phosphate kinase
MQRGGGMKEQSGGTGIKRVNAVAPIRICDIGGWTDTWFAGHGTIFNIAVYPYVEVQIVQHEKGGKGEITIRLENFDKAYSLDPKNISYGAHPLIDAAIDSLGLPPDIALEVNVFSSAPPGASTGTSAAVAVALIGALSGIAGQQLTAYETASLAHAVETEKLHLQCGVQDQLASAYGGINYIQMQEFPHASVSQIQVPNPIWWELENRLALVYIGTPHTSSDIHRKVIEGLGDGASTDPRLERLRHLAAQAKQAVIRGDFESLGRVMNENTEAQRKLHPGLVCAKFEKAIEIAGRFKALGCKVNGAGGDGGSITLLGNGDASMKRRMLDAVAQEGLIPIPIYLSRFGVRVW